MSGAEPRSPRTRWSEIPLWASAFVIAALVIVEAGSLPSPSAQAGQAVLGDRGFAMATVRAAGGGGVELVEEHNT